MLFPRCDHAVVADGGAGGAVELGVVEQRYQAVLEVLEGATVTDVARWYGWRGRRCVTGCGVMPARAVWGRGRIGRPGRRRVRIR